MQKLRSSIFLVLTLFNCVYCGLFLWSTKNIQIPSLKTFDDEDLTKLISYLDGPSVVAFRGDPIALADILQDVFAGNYTAYVPNADLNLPDLIELNENDLNNMNTLRGAVEEKLAQRNVSEHILALIVSSNERRKREVTDSSTSTTLEEPTEEPMELADYVMHTGPTLYSADGRAMVYSSRPPIIRINSTIIVLGKAVVARLDLRATYNRLVVIIPGDGGRKYHLRFKFTFPTAGYWTLASVQFEDGGSAGDRYQLLPTATSTYSTLSASRNFSYHCTGETVFANRSSEVELVLYDVQAQPDIVEWNSGRFSDAYDCTTFTTAPIWSGVLVTGIMMVGLVVGMGALGSIKTMDKFDGSKTKVLPITVSE